MDEQMISTEINRKLAEEVMGFNWSDMCEYDLEIDGVATPGNWNPYDLITHAMMVAKKMFELGWVYLMRNYVYFEYEGPASMVCTCDFINKDGLRFSEQANTQEAAISLAALEARQGVSK